MILKCAYCGREVSGEISDDVYFAGVVMCPVCAEALNERIGLLIEQGKRAIGMIDAELAADLDKHIRPESHLLTCTTCGTKYLKGAMCYKCYGG